jgi:beta-phosphoglucomutase-like phosphatase (HAD superfamily)
MNCNRSVGSASCHQSPPFLALHFNNDDLGMKRLIIFDFDGVIADSEVLANTVLAEVVSELGVPTTLDDALRLYMGKRFHEVIATIEAALGRSLPEHFSDDFQQRTLSRFRSDLRVVAGAQGIHRGLSRHTPLHCLILFERPPRPLS